MLLQLCNTRAAVSLPSLHALRALISTRQARALNRQMPKAAAAVMLPSLSCEQYLHALEAANFDPFLPALQPPPREGSSLMHVLRVKYHLWAGTF